jgi:hypothetical protein
LHYIHQPNVSEMKKLQSKSTALTMKMAPSKSKLR